jgi:5-oxopent-3-ene-1,2,5-tricarboxylate decarboxylase / 2-hydroxyhepta-2,4-diene-1,7-dioate isomerase
LARLDVLRPDLRLLGVARTLRYLPVREDLAASLGMGVQRTMLETLRPGDVLVIDARGEPGAGVIGDISAQRAAVLGAAGVVTDGPLRDAAILASFGLAIYHRGVHPAQPSQRHVPYDSDVAIALAGVTVEPGDLLVGDRDGVVVIPVARAAEIAVAATAQEDEERFVAEQVAKGESLSGLFPMGSRWREIYEGQRPTS